MRYFYIMTINDSISVLELINVVPEDNDGIGIHQYVGKDGYKVVFSSFPEPIKPSSDEFGRDKKEISIGCEELLDRLFNLDVKR